MATLNATLNNALNNFTVKLDNNNSSVTLKNTTVGGKRLDQMTDVSEPDAAKTNGAVLVYNASSDTYVLTDILKYNTTDQSYTLDGGDGF